MDDERLENPELDMEEPIEGDGQEGAVAPHEEEEDLLEDEDLLEGQGEEDADAEGEGEDAGEGSEGADGAPRKPVQSPQENAAAKAARIRAEQETAERVRRETDARIAAMGILNPYSGKPLTSMQELEEYGQRFQEERLSQEAKRTGKTVAQLREEAAAQAFLKQSREAAAAQAAQRDFMQRDLAVFVAKYPEVDPGKLEQNPKFRKFAGRRLYHEPLAELYSDFLELVNDAGRAAVTKAAGKAQRATGGGQDGGKDVLTPSQRRRLEAWNAENPEMKMTPKEFLGQ